MRRFIFIVSVLLFYSTLAIADDSQAVGLLDKAKLWVDVFSNAVLALTILATVLVRAIPGSKDDEAIGKVKAKLLSILHWLPTWGINPNTKALESALEEVEKKK